MGWSLLSFVLYSPSLDSFKNTGSGERLVLLLSDVEDLALKRDRDVPEVGRHLEVML